nr:hypothetical protein [Escherichia coli]
MKSLPFHSASVDCVENALDGLHRGTFFRHVACYGMEYC